MCNIEFPLVQLLKGGEETSWRVIKAGEAACNWPAHHQGSLPTTRALSLPALAPSNLLRHAATNTKDKYTNIHWFKYTIICIQIHKYTWIQIHKYLNHNGSPSQHCLCVTSLLAKLTLQNIEYFSIRTHWASLATKNPHCLFADSQADSH